jgi:protein SMG6
LQSLLLEGKRDASAPRSAARRGPSASASGPPLKIVAGYSMLVIDTNILLSSLPMVAALVESLAWTVVVPLPVVMELDGLAAAAGPLGAAATAATAYIASHARSHALSLKVLTSKGNYLASIAVRTEEVDLADAAAWERSMDDLILRAAVWQDEHWVDRGELLRAPAADKAGAAKVVLLSFDRNRESSLSFWWGGGALIGLRWLFSAVEGTCAAGGSGEREGSRGRVGFCDDVTALRRGRREEKP